MTPKEKAKELYESFAPNVRWKLGQEDFRDRAKRCAVIAVDEILSAIGEYTVYWEEVKEEIEKL